MRNVQTLHFLLAVIFLSTSVLTADIMLVNEISWSPETQLTTHPSQDMSSCIMQAANGTIWVVWVSTRIGSGKDELFYKTSSNYGSEWSPDTRLTDDPSWDSTPSIMQASNGTIWVAWASLRTGNYELFYKTFNGSSWSSDIQLTEEPSRDVEPSIVQVTSGEIWVVWCSYRTGNSDLFYKIYNGSTWSTETQLTYDPQPDKHPSVTQGSDGTIWVVWCSYRTVNYELFCKTFNGTAWSSDTQLTHDFLSDMEPSIAQARDGTIWVVWQRDTPNEAPHDLFYKIYNGSAWSFDTQLTSDPADDISPSIAQINDKRIWVVWEADRDVDYDIYYKTSSEIINHDVAITNVIPSSTAVYQGEIVSVNVTVENQGDMNEVFDVAVYADIDTMVVGDEIIVGTQTGKTLAVSATTTLTFTWNTSEAQLNITYTISAYVPPVNGEVKKANNTRINGKVHVKVPGDVNGDGRVDEYDLARIREAYGSKLGDSNWGDGEADLTNDKVIDLYDLAILSKNYGN